VAALSELPRAQVTAKGGGDARRRLPSSRHRGALLSMRRATTCGASRASRSMAVMVEAVSFLSGIVVLHPFGLADGQLGHEIIGIAAVIGRGELDHLTPSGEGAALDI